MAAPAVQVPAPQLVVPVTVAVVVPGIQEVLVPVLVKVEVPVPAMVEVLVPAMVEELVLVPVMVEVLVQVILEVLAPGSEEALARAAVLRARAPVTVLAPASAAVAAEPVVPPLLVVLDLALVRVEDTQISQLFRCSSSTR